MGQQPIPLEIRLRTGKTWRCDLTDEVEIDETRINRELGEHPAKFAWFATLGAEARRYRDDLKRRLDLLEIELRKEFLAGVLPDEKKPTKDAIDAYITESHRFQKMEQELIEATYQQDILYAAREAMTHRRDMLVTIATNLRRELDVDLGRTAERQSRRERDLPGESERPGEAEPIRRGRR